MQPDGAVNLGSLIRSGIRLSTAEVVSVVYDACKQLEAGLSSALPQHPDDLWIRDTGTVALAKADPASNPKSAVASLLDLLLPNPSDEPEYEVPASLRTLPARLRASGAARAADYKDLLVVLARYLPTDPRALLEQLVRRTVGGAPLAAVAVAPPAAVAAAPLAAVAAAPLAVAVAPPAVPVAPPVVAVAPLAAVAAASPSPAAAPLTSDPGDPGDVLLIDTRERVAHTTPVPPVVEHRRRAIAPLIAAALLLMLASGYFGYRFSQSTGTLDSTSSTPAVEEPNLPAQGPPAAPRIVVVPRSEASEPPTRAASANAPFVAPPQPLILEAPDGAFSPFFTADNTLLFHTGRASVGRMLSTKVDAGGRSSNTVTLFDDGAKNYHPRMSPDGRLLAFDSDSGGERGVYVLQRDAGQRRRVSGDGYAAVPSWSPDSRRLAFIKAEPDRPRVWNLWILDLASGDLRRHSGFRSGQVWGASWFPDGRRIAYTHEDQLFIADLGTGVTTNIPSPVARRLVRTPAVSPDGRQIVFQVFRDGAWVLDVATGRVRRILDDPSAEEFAWEPGGRRVAYHSRRDGQWRIWLMTI